jgi:hypothetical protein
MARARISFSERLSKLRRLIGFCGGTPKEKLYCIEREYSFASVASFAVKPQVWEVVGASHPQKSRVEVKTGSR